MLVSSPWLGPSTEGAPGWHQVKVPCCCHLVFDALTALLLPALHPPPPPPPTGKVRGGHGALGCDGWGLGVTMEAKMFEK